MTQKKNVTSKENNLKKIPVPYSAGSSGAGSMNMTSDIVMVSAE
jgi:hypothetical protein